MAFVITFYLFNYSVFCKTWLWRISYMVSRQKAAEAGTVWGGLFWELTHFTFVHSYEVTLTAAQSYMMYLKLWMRKKDKRHNRTQGDRIGAGFETSNQVNMKYPLMSLGAMLRFQHLKLGKEIYSCAFLNFIIDVCYNICGLFSFLKLPALF